MRFSLGQLLHDAKEVYAPKHISPIRMLIFHDRLVWYLRIDIVFFQFFPSLYAPIVEETIYNAINFNIRTA
jgi:hypothetical protein